MNNILVKSLTVPVCSFVMRAILSEVVPKKVDTNMATNGPMDMMF